MNIQTNLPTNAQVSECVTQMIKKQPCTHSQRVQGWAQLRLADFSPVLNEWAIDQAHISDKLAALPQVANALKTPKLPQEHAEKLIAFIQHHAAQGQQTAQLYWAYCLATGKYTTQNPAKAVKIVHQLQKKNDWRGTRFLGEMFALAPLAAVDLLAEDIQTHSKAHYAQNPQLNLSDILQQCQAFATSPAAIKFIVRTQLETATKQGSPTATQRLRGLTSLGLASADVPPKQYRSLPDWLAAQTQHSQYMAATQNIDNSDPDILVLPDNMPYLSHDNLDENEVPRKVAIAGGILLLCILLFVLALKLMF